VSDTMVTIVFMVVVATVVFSPTFFEAVKPKRPQKQKVTGAKQQVITAAEGEIQGKKEAGDAQQIKESQTAGLLNLNVTSAVKIIPPDNKDIFSGSMKLLIDPSARCSKILLLIDSLSNYSDIKIVSMGNIAEGGPWVELFVKKSMPLYQVLYSLPGVQQAARKGQELQITLSESE
jgi:hypothetical protein